jgi:hypothetical protein
MANAHGVCVEWLLTGRGPKHPGGTPDPELSRLLEFWDDLPPLEKHDVVSYAVYKGTTLPPKNGHDKPADSARKPRKK